MSRVRICGGILVNCRGCGGILVIWGERAAGGIVDGLERGEGFGLLAEC